MLTTARLRFALLLLALLMPGLLLLSAVSPGAAAPAEQASSPEVETANVFFVHLAPFVGGPATVQVAVGCPTVATLNYGGTSGTYLSVPAGPTYVSAREPGAAAPLAGQSLTFAAGQSYTVAIVGGSNGWPVEFVQMTDDGTPPPSGRADLRVVHAAPFTQPLDATRVDVFAQFGPINIPLQEDLPYKTVIVSEDPLPAGEYDLLIRRSSDDSVLYDPGPVSLTDGQIVTGFFAGDGANQPYNIFLINHPAPPVAGPAQCPRQLYLPLTR